MILKRFMRLAVIACGCTATTAFAADTSLETLIAHAIGSHPAMRSQAALVTASETGLDSARWQFFPQPSISLQQAHASRTDPGYVGDKTVTILALNQALWTGGRLSAGVDRAEAAAASALASQAEMQQQIAIRVIQAYGEWLTAYRKRLAYENGVDRHRRLREQFERRVDIGQAAANDLTLADSRLVGMNAELRAVQAQERIGLSRLENLTGAQLGSATLAQDPAHARSLSLRLPELLAQATSHSPGLARRRAQADIEQANIKATKARLLPEISARLEQQYGNHSVTGQSTSQHRVFVTLSTQFGAGLSNMSAVTEAVQRHTAALFDVEAELKSLNEQVITDLALLTDSEARKNDLEQAVALAEKVLQAWERQYFSGRKNWQDLMNSAREFVQTQAQLADLEGARLIASWRLALLTGNQKPGHNSNTPAQTQ